ncbi:hypothetical protein RHECNPAF_4460065 [Rhizobium etli CNPAF512]|nr:hypothetical protein RHECNPAF_4460065 [Rhizobium etli CNPAF512]
MAAWRKAGCPLAYRLAVKIPADGLKSPYRPVAKYSTCDSTFYLSASCKMIREYP